MGQPATPPAGSPGYYDSIRWLRVYNTETEACPGGGLVRVTGSDEDGVLLIAKPNTTGSAGLLVASPFGIPAEGHGVATGDSPVPVLFLTGTPAIGEMWGTAVNGWHLSRGWPGFRIVADPSDSTVEAERDPDPTRLVEILGAPSSAELYPARLVEWSEQDDDWTDLGTIRFREPSAADIPVGTYLFGRLGGIAVDSVTFPVFTGPHCCGGAAADPEDPWYCTTDGGSGHRWGCRQFADSTAVITQGYTEESGPYDTYEDCIAAGCSEIPLPEGTELCPGVCADITLPTSLCVTISGTQFNGTSGTFPLTYVGSAEGIGWQTVYTWEVVRGDYTDAYFYHLFLSCDAPFRGQPNGGRFVFRGRLNVITRVTATGRFQGGSVVASDEVVATIGGTNTCDPLELTFDANTYGETLSPSYRLFENATIVVDETSPCTAPESPEDGASLWFCTHLGTADTFDCREFASAIAAQTAGYTVLSDAGYDTEALCDADPCEVADPPDYGLVTEAYGGSCECGMSFQIVAYYGGNGELPITFAINYGDDTAESVVHYGGPSLPDFDHCYDEAGVYTVTLTATDAIGQQGSREVVFTVNCDDPEYDTEWFCITEYSGDYGGPFSTERQTFTREYPVGTFAVGDIVAGTDNGYWIGLGVYGRQVITSGPYATEPVDCDDVPGSDCDAAHPLFEGLVNARADACAMGGSLWYHFVAPSAGDFTITANYGVGTNPMNIEHHNTCPVSGSPSTGAGTYTITGMTAGQVAWIQVTETGAAVAPDNAGVSVFAL